MTTREEIYAAIRNADKAGDSDSVRALGAYLQTMPAEAPAAQPAQSGGGMGLANMTPTGIIRALATPGGRQDITNTLAGNIRGAGSIGASLMWPIDKLTDAIKGDRAPTVTGLVTGKQPLTRNEERRQGMTEALRQMGADPSSSLFQAGKFGTEIAGTAGTGAALTGALRAIPAVSQAAQTSPALARILAAMESGGASVGPQAAQATGVGLLPRVSAGAANMGARMLGGGVNGFASAGLVNPADAVSGGLLGAAAPATVKTLGRLGDVASSAVKHGAAMVSDSVAARLAAQKVGAGLGSPSAIAQAIADLQTYYPKGAENIPVSAAGITRSPAVSALELQSRMTSPQPWTMFDQRQGGALWDNLKAATAEAADLGARKADRAANWNANWQAASGNFKPRNWDRRMTQLGTDIQTALQSPEASNPEVRNALQGLWDEVVRVGPDFSPAHLQQIRAQFTGKVPMNPTNAFKAAPRDAPAVISMIREMDDILNSATGNKWQKVVSGYANDSQGVQAAKAAGLVQEAFIDPQTGMLRKTALAPDVPQVTQAGLRSAIDRARMPNGVNALSAPALQRMQATLDAIQRQDMVKLIAKSASGNTGSDTAGKLSLLAESQLPGLLGQVVGVGKAVVNGKKNQAMAGLLADPDELAKALELLNRPGAGGLLGSSAAAALPYRVAPALVASP